MYTTTFAVRARSVRSESSKSAISCVRQESGSGNEIKRRIVWVRVKRFFREDRTAARSKLLSVRRATEILAPSFAWSIIAYASHCCWMVSAIDTELLHGIVPLQQCRECTVTRNSHVCTFPHCLLAAKWMVFLERHLFEDFELRKIYEDNGKCY